MPSLTSSLWIAGGAAAVILLAAIVFSMQIQRLVGPKIEDRLAAWDVFIKGVTLVTGIMAGLLAFLRYIDQREAEFQAQLQATAQQVREFNIDIYGKAATTDQAKRIFLNEAADTAATLATLDDLNSPTGQIALDRFERLYFGQLVLYEGDDVARAMRNFRTPLRQWQQSGKKPVGSLPEEDLGDTDQMRELSLALSRACAKELRELPATVPESVKAVK
jgi:multisubunit Na+/H+ antiporter MnhF subunit